MYLEALSYTCHLTYPPPPPPHLTTHPQHIINTHQMSPSSGRTCLYLHEFADVLAAIHGAGRSAKLDGHFRPQQHHCFEVVGLGLLLTMLYALLSLHLPPPPRTVCRALRRARGHRKLTGACNPMLRPIHVFRPTFTRRGGATWSMYSLIWA